MSEVRHPAKFSAPILTEIDKHLLDSYRVLDPFGGVGGIHTLPPETYAVEIESEWADVSRGRGWTVCADATDLPPRLTFTFGDEVRDVALAGYFDAIVTSPTYGSRMADDHTPGPADKSVRNTYRHTLGKPLRPNNTGAMQWGPPYRTLHRIVWAKCIQWLRPGGHLIVNVKDHIRKGEVVPVSAWHLDYLKAIGFDHVSTAQVPVRGNGFGANGKLRVPHEDVHVLRI